jgi:hypothetical protein
MQLNISTSNLADVFADLSINSILHNHQRSQSIIITLDHEIVVNGRYSAPSTFNFSTHREHQGERTFNYDWIITKDETTEYFIQPLCSPLPLIEYTCLVSFTGVLPSANYHTEYRHQALIKVRALLPHQFQHSLTAAYHAVKYPSIEASNTVLALYLPTDELDQMSLLYIQQQIMRGIQSSSTISAGSIYQKCFLGSQPALICPGIYKDPPSIEEIKQHQSGAQYLYYNKINNNSCIF